MTMSRSSQRSCGTGRSSSVGAPRSRCWCGVSRRLASTISRGSSGGFAMVRRGRSSMSWRPMWLGRCLLRIAVRWGVCSTGGRSTPTRSGFAALQCWRCSCHCAPATRTGIGSVGMPCRCLASGSSSFARRSAGSCATCRGGPTRCAPPHPSHPPPPLPLSLPSPPPLLSLPLLPPSPPYLTLSPTTSSSPISPPSLINTSSSTPPSYQRPCTSPLRHSSLPIRNLICPYLSQTSERRRATHFASSPTPTSWRRPDRVTWTTPGCASRATRKASAGWGSTGGSCIEIPAPAQSQGRSAPSVTSGATFSSSEPVLRACRRLSLRRNGTRHRARTRRRARRPVRLAASVPSRPVRRSCPQPSHERASA